MQQLDKILNHAAGLRDKQHQLPAGIGLFTARPINESIEEVKGLPVPQSFCSGLFYEGETVILYADTNVGKSILGMQIANGIAEGADFMGLGNDVTIGLMVGYVDCELSAFQLLRRYSDAYGNTYQFSSRLIRTEINTDAEYPSGATLEEYFLLSLEQWIVQHQLRAVVVDNITYLNSDTEKAKNATPLMQKLQALKRKYSITLIILAHTPKRDKTRPITGNDLAGSKMLLNFCDSAFAIGESVQDPALRYVKQIKQRNTEQLYGTDNILLYRIAKQGAFLHFEYLGNDNEAAHLRVIDQSERENLEADIKRLYDADNTISSYAIAQKLHPSQPPNTKFESFKVKVNRIYKRLTGSDGK